MKKLIVVLFALALALVSCTKGEPKLDPFRNIACSIGKTVGTVVALGIQDQLGCKNLPAIQDSIEDALVLINVCAAQPKGVLLANPVCVSVGNALAKVIVSQGIPAAWECDSGANVDKFLAVVTKLCEKVK